MRVVISTLMSSRMSFFGRTTFLQQIENIFLFLLPPPPSFPPLDPFLALITSQAAGAAGGSEVAPRSQGAAGAECAKTRGH